MATLFANIGAASLDDIREIFNLPTYGGDIGSRRVQTLNIANAEGVNDYQGIAK